MPEPSIADLRALFSSKPVAEAVPSNTAAETPKTTTPEAPPESTDGERPRDEHGRFLPKEEEEQITEAESGPARAEEPETPVEEVEEPLPPGVQKRIAKEAAKQARIQAEIDRAVSATKVKESELASLTAAGTPGPEPAKTTASAKGEGKPTKPKLEDFQSEADPYTAFNAAQADYEEKHDAWLIAETKRTVETEITARQQKEQNLERWNEALEEHGPEYPALMDTVCAASSPGFQIAVSSCGDKYSHVAVYLAKHPEELKSLSAEYETDPYRATAALGALHYRLTKQEPAPEPPKPTVAPTKPLPEPPGRAGGRPSAVAEIDLNKTDNMSEFRQAVKPLLKHR